MLKEIIEEQIQLLKKRQSELERFDTDEVIQLSEAIVNLSKKYDEIFGNIETAELKSCFEQDDSFRGHIIDRFSCHE